jgi:hypothetical protein
MPEVVPPNIKPVAEGDIFSRLVNPTVAALALMLGEGCAAHRTNTGALIGQLPSLSMAERDAAARSAHLARERDHALNVAHSLGMNNVVYLASNGELSTSFKDALGASGTTQGLHSFEMTVRENGSELNFRMQDLERWKEAQATTLRDRHLLGVLFDLSGKVVAPNNPNIKIDPVAPFISPAKHGAGSPFSR